jgi:hypothetical protein
MKTFFFSIKIVTLDIILVYDHEKSIDMANSVLNDPWSQYLIEKLTSISLSKDLNFKIE